MPLLNKDQPGSNELLHEHVERRKPGQVIPIYGVSAIVENLASHGFEIDHFGRIRKKTNAVNH